MLKGILPQLNSINSYIQSILPLELQDLTWEIFLLNTEKNTFQILKLVQIILNQLEENLPKGVKYQFQRSCSLLKKYFKCRPKLQIEHEDHNKQLHMQQYDQVQQYLDNKPEISINNEQRSELFRFLSLNDQKEKDNTMLLQSIPRYNFDYSYHRKSIDNKKSTNNKKKANPSEFSKVIIQKCDSQTIQNCSSQVNIFRFTDQVQVQTEQQNHQSQQQNYNKQLLDVATSMTDLLENMEIIGVRKKNKNIEEQGGKKSNDNQAKKKKKTNNKDQGNKIISQSKSNQLIIQNQTITQLKRNARGSAMLSQAKTIKDLSNFQTTKQENKQKKKKQSKRQSSNSILSNKKDIKSLFSKNSQKRLSKDLNKVFNQSKFSKQKKNICNQYPSTILQTKQQLTNSYVNAELLTENQTVNKENQQVVEALFNYNNSRVIINIPGNKNTEESTTKQEESKNTCTVKENNQIIQREKIISNKEGINKYQSLVQKAYANTIGHPFYRKPSKNQKNQQRNENSSLPKIQQKSTKAKYESIEVRKKKKTYENSPYAKPNIQLLANQKIFKNNSNVLNHRSFHLNPLETKLAFSPTSFNRTQKTQKSQQDLDGSYKNCSSFSKFQLNPTSQVGQAQRQLILEGQHNKIVKEIQESIINKNVKDFQWSKLMKNIKYYEHLHISLCGENCIHLNKFYQFLKKKNLSIYANRKELLLHKKNIEINYH